MSRRCEPDISLRWELVDCIHPSLATLDYSNPVVKAWVVATGVGVSVGLLFVVHAFFSRTTQVYADLKLKHKVFWSLAVVRGAYGVFCTIVSLWAVFGHTGLEEDIVFATTPTSQLAMCVSVGFFVFECTAVTLSDLWFGSFSHLLHVHHWLSLFGFAVVVYTDTGHQIGCKGLLLEMSTPFSCLCWTLLKAGLERSLLWRVNQFLLVHSFHLRNVVEMMIWYLTWNHRTQIWTHMPTALFTCLYLNLTLITLIMTPYWTYKKSQQLFSPVDWNFETTVPAPAPVPHRRGSAVHTTLYENGTSFYHNRNGDVQNGNTNSVVNNRYHRNGNMNDDQVINGYGNGHIIGDVTKGPGKWNEYRNGLTLVNGSSYKKD